MVRSKLLQTCPLFGGISNEVIEEIRPVLREEHFSKGEYIIKEGEEGDRLYLLYEGSVEVLKEISSPRGVEQRRLTLLGKGETFGEMELLDMLCCSASVRALEEVSTLTLSNRDMYKIYKSNLPAFTMIVMNLAREISRRLRRMDALVGSSLYSGPQGKNGLSGHTDPAGGSDKQ